MTMSPTDERYTRGVETMTAIVGPYAATLDARLGDLAPGFVRSMIAYAFGEICERPGLDLKTREIVTVAALAAMGTAGPQLAVHIKGARNVGWSRAAVAEAIIQVSLYAGIPAALNALGMAKTVFAEENADETGR